MNNFSDDSQLNKEHNFYVGIVALVYSIIGFGAFIMFLIAVEEADQHGWLSYQFAWRFIIGLLIVVYYQLSKERPYSVFYFLDNWEQSLLHRKTEYEIVLSVKAGKRIFKDFNNNGIYSEVDIVNNIIIPKQNGISLSAPDNMNSQLKADKASLKMKHSNYSLCEEINLSENGNLVVVKMKDGTVQSFRKIIRNT